MTSPQGSGDIKNVIARGWGSGFFWASHDHCIQELTAAVVIYTRSSRSAFQHAELERFRRPHS